MTDSRQKTMRVTIAALATALVTMMTMIHIPVPVSSGYIHPGDSMIYASAWMLGPFAALPAGLGSMFADMVSGWAQYAPVSLVVKALMGLVVALLMKMLPERIWGLTVAMLVGSALMVAGYFAFDWVVFGIAAATVNLYFNLVQAVGGVILGIPLIMLLRTIPQVKELRSH